MLKLLLIQFSLTQPVRVVMPTAEFIGAKLLTVNVDNGDQPVNIDLRPGKYNATQLAAEVERAINAAYGDDNNQVVQNIDDTLSVNLFKLNADGSSTGLSTAVSVDLLADSYVSTVEGITLTGASPDFTRDQFLARSSTNEYSVDTYASTAAGGVLLV